MSVRRALFVPAVLAVGAALSLTACSPGDVTADPQPAKSTASAASAPSTPATPSAPGAAGAPSAAASGAPAARPAASTAPSHPAAGPTGATSATGGSGTAGGSDGDAYAYGHPCESKQLTVRLTARSGAPTQRVIEVHNQGPRSCGLSYFPLVNLGDSRSADRSKDVKPLVPGGLGGAPAFPVAAGQTVYAVLDLNPSGAAGGTVPGIDEVNVLADGDHMPTAETVNLPLGPGAKVLKPRLGLYRATVADAAASAAGADRQL
ncbi:DUF4232 domain-containing protein [Kitasatospora sp. NPDC054939]